MFDCKSLDYGAISSFVYMRNISRDGGQSFGLPLEMDRATITLGIEVRQFYEPLVYDLSKIARERIQRMLIFDTKSGSAIQEQRHQVTRYLRLLLGNAKDMSGKILYESVSMIFCVLPHLMDTLRQFGWHSVWDRNVVGYEVYHGVLEWNWLLMLVLKEAKECATNIEMSNEFFDKKPMKTFGTIYRDLMVDLLDLAYQQYCIHVIDNITNKSSYSCYCVKHMWLGLMILADTEKLDFWKCLNECMPASLKDKHDAYMFKIWHINTLARLYDEKMKLAEEAPLLTLPNNYTVIDDIVKDFLKSDITEFKARVFLTLLKPIVTVFWPARIETVIALWNYYSSRINSAFRTNRNSFETIGCVSSTVEGFINQAASLAAPESIHGHFDLEQNSFQMFLRLLSWIIHHYTAQAHKKKVQIIFNRIFVKMGPNKYEKLTERGVYNLGLMLLTMMSATSFDNDYSRVSGFMQLVPLTYEEMKLPIDHTIMRITVASRANMAILVLLSSSSFDKTKHIVTFLDSIDVAYRKYGDRLQPALEIIAEGMCLIYKKAVLQKSFNRGEKSLLRSWVQKYLRHCSTNRWQMLLDVLADTLKAFNGSTLSEECYNALNQHVMPFVNERYFNKVAAPPCIPRLAARMIIHCASSNTKNDRISWSFEMYVNSPETCTDQVLACMKEIAQCSKTLAAIDQILIIRQWLKMAILHDAKSLLDLTRIVHGLDELKTLCKIPEYDRFVNNDIPVKLFFRLVGTRYRESDACMRMEMKKKLYTVFEDFDKWFPDSAAIRQRVFAVLILALKECPLAFYFRGNSKCLYSIAFQHFFLPFCVLVDRNVQLDFIEAIAQIWHHVMDFLGDMDYRHDEIIADNVYNMMNKWVPQFAKLTNVKQSLRPVMLFFCARNEDLVLFAMTRFVQTFVDLKRCLPNEYAVEVMEILKNLIKALVKQKNYGKISLFIRTMGLSVTQHAFMCNEKYHTRLIASEILFDLLTSTNEPSNLIKEEMRNVLIAFTLKYFPISEECYMKFMSRFVFRYPYFFRSLIDFIRRDEAETEITCAQNKTDGVLSLASYMLQRELDTKLKSKNEK
ncbi:uncharacterized protein LOC128711104 [Anopheles marshallii]|uniref:uncharacterized protein LOC128711104 n=1 Tax=Anopheles marshallii TaxID=1521116 RepID=UPI00237B27E9|nr:uncharacterized protein LOC128711104 [Anopheles marshallii]